MAHALFIQAVSKHTANCIFIYRVSHSKIDYQVADIFGRPCINKICTIKEFGWKPTTFTLNLVRRGRRIFGPHCNLLISDCCYGEILSARHIWISLIKSFSVWWWCVTWRGWKEEGICLCNKIPLSK